MKTRETLLFGIVVLACAAFPAELLGQYDCSFCHPCPDPDEVQAKPMDISIIAIHYPAFACSPSEGCGEEPSCDSQEEDEEEQTELLALLDGTDLQALRSFGERLKAKIQTVPERNLLLFSSVGCGNRVIRIFEATRAQIQALDAPPDR